MMCRDNKTIRRLVLNKGDTIELVDTCEDTNDMVVSSEYLDNIKDKLWEIEAHLKRRDDQYEEILKQLVDKLNSIEEKLNKVI